MKRRDFILRAALVGASSCIFKSKPAWASVDDFDSVEQSLFWARAHHAILLFPARQYELSEKSKTILIEQGVCGLDQGRELSLSSDLFLRFS